MIALNGNPAPDEALVQVARELELHAIGARREVQRGLRRCGLGTQTNAYMLSASLVMVRYFAVEMQKEAGKAPRTWCPLPPSLVCSSCGVRALPGIEKCPRCGEERS